MSAKHEALVSRRLPEARRPERALLAAPAPQVAQHLLGLWLVRWEQGRPVGGRIVETEAYDETDPASHSYKGQRRSNATMFGRPGLLYVYRSYGVHWCMNIACGPKGFGAAVLVRAVEPLLGTQRMAAGRGFAVPPKKLAQLTAGPGRLTQALGIDGGLDGLDLLDDQPLQLLLPADVTPHTPQIVATPRIGIRRATELPWRFIDASSACLSGSRKHNRR